MNEVEVAFLPFWRYAVGPMDQCTPCIPFYRRESAMKLFNDAQDRGFSAVMYQRVWGGVVLIKEYGGRHQSASA